MVTQISMSIWLHFFFNNGSPFFKQKPKVSKMDAVIWSWIGLCSIFLEACRQTWCTTLDNATSGLGSPINIFFHPLVIEKHPWPYGPIVKKMEILFSIQNMEASSFRKGGRVLWSGKLVLRECKEYPTITFRFFARCLRCTSSYWYTYTLIVL